MRIIGISGSLRRSSFNTGLLRAAVALMPEGAALEIAAIDEIPLYNYDLEASAGIPASVAALKDDKVRAQLRDFVQGFVQFVAASRSPKSPSSA
jgi:chromate reductase